MVKAEYRRGGLEPTHLRRSTVAIDGKNVATLHWPDMLRLLGLEATKTTVAEVTARFAQRYPQAQVCTRDNGAPYALLRVHTRGSVQRQGQVHCATDAVLNSRSARGLRAGPCTHP